MSIRWAMALFLLAGCPRRSSGPELVPPAPPAPTIAVAPLRVAEVAGPQRGLVLGAGGRGRAAPVELVGRARQVEVTLDGGRTATIEVAPADPGLPVRPPPPGPEWTAALVRAELAATAALALAPGRFTVSVRVPSGAAPPGSATLAVAVLAGLTGAAVDPRAAVLADLAADGTLVALEDPTAALERAIARGARRIILPLGGAAFSPRGGKKPVDLVKQAARRGAAAALAPDLPHAYRALTGAPMPEAAPLDAADMALSPGESDALRAAYQRHLQRVAEAWPALVEQQTRARLSAPIAALVDAAAAGSRRAERLRASREIAAATIRLTRAASAADAARRIEDVLTLVRNGDAAGAAAALGAGLATPPIPPIAPAGSPPERSPPEHDTRSRGVTRWASAQADGHLRAIAAAQAAAESAAWSAEAAALAPAAQAAVAAAGKERATLEAEHRLAEALAPALLAAARAREHSARAADRLSFPAPAGAGFVPDAAALSELTRRHREAAGALLAVADRKPAAAPRSAELTEARRLLADSAASTASPAARLGAARLAHELVERAFARSREVAADIDLWSGAVVRIGHPERLAIALRVAERTARQAAAAARTAAGRVPLAARINYQAARALAAGRAADRLFALELYRASSSESRLAVLLITAKR
ncbi:MAG TPA: hypothetical protein VIG06_05995 [Kofleriaceae bacterium]|jgi:hypothetical protein